MKHKQHSETSTCNQAELRIAATDQWTTTFEARKVRHRFKMHKPPPPSLANCAERYFDQPQAMQLVRTDNQLIRDRHRDAHTKKSIRFAAPIFTNQVMFTSFAAATLLLLTLCHPIVTFTTSSSSSSPQPRELVRRNTGSSSSATSSSSSAIAALNAASNNPEAIRQNEISQNTHNPSLPSSSATSSHHHHPQVPSNYVKLGNTTSSHARTFQPTNLGVQLRPITSTTSSAATPSSSSSSASTSSHTNTSDMVAGNLFGAFPAVRKLPEKICIGTSSRLSGQADKTEHYQGLVERYRNCTHVIGNLELTWLEKGPNNRPLDLSFLESIREITGYLLISYVDVDKIRLPNLQIIRGRETFKVKSTSEEFAMFVHRNELKYLELPNLREIIYGHVGFYYNKNLCSVNSIDWVEILNTNFMPRYAYDSIVPAPECPECHRNCQQPSCWGPEESLCQRFSKTTCPPQCDKGRCYGPGPRDCCHIMCAGGCTGPKQTDCFACKNFSNEDECVPECPPMNKYNPSKFLWEPDPNGRHAYGAKCVKECPDHLLRDNGACVRSCPTDKRSLDGECVPCAGPCPKNCQGVDTVNSRNIEQLVNCTEIEGSITILDQSFTGYRDVQSNNTMGEEYAPMHPSRLRVLETVRTITGYLNIQANHSDFTDLSFLSKLETIGGRQTTDMFHSLSIIKTTLKSLNLRSLKRVRAGHIRIEENKELCYGADAALFSRSNIAKEENIIIRNNGDDKMCHSLGHRCHEQCAHGGCWGPSQSECLACKHYKLEDYCVNDCSSTTRHLGVLSFDAGDRTCGRCHEECRGGCNGISARNCWQCKNLKDGPYCVPECPKHKYNDHGVCQECSKRCVNGCTGPSDRLGSGGCNVCDKFIVESTSNSTIVASCIRADEPCPRGYYQEYGAEVDDNHPAKLLERKPVCKKCHRKCKSCSGYGTHKDVCECAGYMANDQCEDTCPRDFYPDEKLRKCLRCSRECNGCFGPSEADCLNCRVYRLYYDSNGPVASARVTDKLPLVGAGGSKQQGRFNCTSQCPPEKPHRISESNLIDPYCSEDPGSDPDNPRIVSIGSASVILVFIAAPAIIICVFIYMCQIEKNKTVKLTMQLSGIGNDAEPVEESNVAPNLAPLRSIKETDLRRGDVLGSGFGGTVYQGLWYPDGQKSKMKPVVCAIKVLRDNGQTNMNKEFLDEAYIMASVNHPNLVKLLAVCMTPRQLMLITEYIALGCLLDYVKQHKQTITPKYLLEWGKQIAQGMAYLEEHRMVHRDLALRNVLIRTNKQVLISDFGLAKLLDVDQSEYQSGGGRLPIKWLAPECIREKKFTHKSDVWAFGVTIWELLTFGKRPFRRCKTQDVPKEIEKGLRLKQPRYVTAEVYKIMYACWFYEPDCRPDFKSLTQDFISFARDPERYLSWNTARNEDEVSDNYDSDSGSLDDDDDDDDEDDIDSPHHSTAESELLNQHNRMNEMMDFGLRQHNSDSATPNGHTMGPPSGGKMGMFMNSSCQPLMAEDVFLRSSQQMSSSKSSNMTITDPNNNNNNFGMPTSHNNFMNGTSNTLNTARPTSESWWSAGNTLSTNSLGPNRSELPTDSEDYLEPSPCSNEEKYTKFYERQGTIPTRPRPPSSRDPPHSAGLIGISNDAYFITRAVRYYSNSNSATNASSSHNLSTVV